MTRLWTVEPRDTLIVRDARPVMEGAGPMRSLDFPWPSTLAGMVRTRVGLDADGTFTLTPDEARAIAVAGPLLWSIGKDDDESEPLLPAPLDAMWFRLGEGDAPARSRQRVRLKPRPVGARVPAEASTDAPDDPMNDPMNDVVTDLSASRPALEHLFLAEPRAEKPTAGPAFWRWDEAKAWLEAPSDLLEDPQGTFGLPPLLRERRTHVAIDSGSHTAAEGQLFQTESLRFVTQARERLALAFLCDDPRLEAKQGAVSLGGERRVSLLRGAEGGAAPALSQIPEKLRAHVREHRTARVVLVTPALFATGALPGSGADGADGAGTFGAGVTLTAAAVGRAEPVSGWDFAAGGPKPVRRAAPRGSVYWVRLDEGWTDEQVDAWLEATWLGCVSDDEQDRKDGFGLALVGVA